MHTGDTHEFKSCEELRSHGVDMIGYFKIDGANKYCGPECKIPNNFTNIQFNISI